MKTKTYAWKVVCCHTRVTRRNIYTSAVVTGAAKIRYYVNRWIEPPKWLKMSGQFITVFNARSDARRFRLCRSNGIQLKIFRCQGDGEIPNQSFYDTTELHYKNFRTSSGVWPSGTRFFKRIKLLPEKKLCLK